MQMQIGNVKMKISREEYLKSLKAMEKGLEAMSSKINPNIFKDFYKMTPPNMASYFEEFGKMMEKFSKVKKPN